MDRDSPGCDTKPAELPSLTALRGLAAIIVVIYHSAFLAAKFAGGGTPGIAGRGYLAVDLFFFLSGFVLAHVYHDRFDGLPRWSEIRRFLWARLCRIYPMIAFTAALLTFKYALGTLALPAGCSFKAQITATLLLMQVPWLDHVALNGPSWSISAEFYAYLLFPLAISGLWLLRGRILAVAVTLLAVATVLAHLVPGQYNEGVSGWGALARALPEFMIGILLYRSYARGLLRRVWRQDAVLAGIVLLIALGCLGGASDIALTALLPALLLAAVGNDGIGTRLLNAAPLRWLGEISYAVYIFQVIPMMLMEAAAAPLTARGWGGGRFAALTVLLIIAGGALAHRCIDLPLRAMLRRLPAQLAGFAPRPASADPKP